MVLVRGIIVLLLFHCGSSMATNICEKEQELAAQALNFSKHPLYTYLKPEGAKALMFVLDRVDRRCLKVNHIYSSACEKQRTEVVDLMVKEMGFENVSEIDFQDVKFFKLADELEDLFKAKLKSMYSDFQRASGVEKHDVRAKLMRFRRRSIELVEHLKESRRTAL